MIAGTAEPGASIKLYVDGSQVATTTADAAGNWSVQLSALTAGARTITASQTVGGANSGPSLPLVLTVQWNDPDATGHADFKADRGWLLGATTALTSIFDTIVTSPQLVTMANGALKSIAANALPLSDLGLELWETRSNRLAHSNPAPAAPTGLALSGDAAATLTVVSDTAVLNAGILAGLVTAGVLNGSDLQAG